MPRLVTLLATTVRRTHVLAQLVCHRFVCLLCAADGSNGSQNPSIPNCASLAPRARAVEFQPFERVPANCRGVFKETCGGVLARVGPGQTARQLDSRARAHALAHALAHACPPHALAHSQGGFHRHVAVHIIRQRDVHAPPADLHDSTQRPQPPWW